jgi:hypothetical protein
MRRHVRINVQAYEHIHIYVGVNGAYHMHAHTCTRAPCCMLRMKPLFGIEEAPCVPLRELAAGQGHVCRLHAVPLIVQRVVKLPHIAVGAGPFLCHMIRCRNEPRLRREPMYGRTGPRVWHTNVCLKSPIHSSGSKLPSAISTHFLCHSFSSAKSKPVFRLAQQHSV